MEERILAEAELLAGAKYRLIRQGVRAYLTEYSEDQRHVRWAHPSLDRALEDFKKAVEGEERLHQEEVVVDAEVERSE